MNKIIVCVAGASCLYFSANAAGPAVDVQQRDPFKDRFIDNKRMEGTEHFFSFLHGTIDKLNALYDIPDSEVDTILNRPSGYLSKLDYYASLLPHMYICAFWGGDGYDEALDLEDALLRLHINFMRFEPGPIDVNDLEGYNRKISRLEWAREMIPAMIGCIKKLLVHVSGTISAQP
ncbi:MAG: hypothetical protein LBJ89_04675 [Holosporales bacterium]|nr:hypothetical protein [Holosporales bacterium]